MSTFSKVFILIILLLILNCTSSDSNSKAQNSELFFDVDSTKLGNQIENIDYGIKYSPPKGWELIAPELFKQFSQKSQPIQFGNTPLEDKKLLVQPISIFLKQENSCILYLSSIKGLEQEPDSGIAYEKYKNIVTQNFDSSLIKKGDFIRNNIAFTQFVLQHKNQISFKLVFLNHQNKIMQFDYIIPKQSYINELKAIESSLGSIQLK